MGWGGGEPGEGQFSVPGHKAAGGRQQGSKHLLHKLFGAEITNFAHGQL